MTMHRAQLNIAKLHHAQHELSSALPIGKLPLLATALCLAGCVNSTEVKTIENRIQTRASAGFGAPEAKMCDSFLSSRFGNPLKREDEWRLASKESRRVAIANYTFRLAAKGVALRDVAVFGARFDWGKALLTGARRSNLYVCFAELKGNEVIPFAAERGSSVGLRGRRR